MESEGECDHLLEIWESRHFRGSRDVSSETPLSYWSLLQRFPRVTSIGSLPPENLRKSHGPPQNPAETPQNPRRDPAEPSERPPQSPLRGKFPRRASRRVVPLGWWPSGTFRTFFYAAPIGAFFCPEIRAFTGFRAEFSSTVSKVLSDRKVLFKHKKWPLIAVNGR